MKTDKNTFIKNFVRYIEKVLQNDLPEEGFEGELWDKAMDTLTKRKTHIDAAYKWPG